MTSRFRRSTTSNCRIIRFLTLTYWSESIWRETLKMAKIPLYGTLPVKQVQYERPNPDVVRHANTCYSPSTLCTTRSTIWNPSTIHF
jgi:hypothetical protein